MTVSARRTTALFVGATLPHVACVASILLPILAVGSRFGDLGWISDMFVLTGILALAYCWVLCRKHPPKLLWVATLVFVLTLPLHAVLAASHESGCLTGQSLTMLWWWITSPVGLRYYFHQHFF